MLPLAEALRLADAPLQIVVLLFMDTAGWFAVRTKVAVFTQPPLVAVSVNVYAPPVEGEKVIAEVVCPLGDQE